MNKLIITGISTIMLIASGTVLAQDEFTGERERNVKQQRGMQSMPVVSLLMRAVRHLDLSDEQKVAVKEVMHGLKVDMRPVNGEMKANHLQLKDLITADTFDENAVALLAETEGKLAADRLMITSRAISDIYAQLTDEQRVELKTMATERKARMGERRQKRKGGGGSESATES